MALANFVYRLFCSKCYEYSFLVGQFGLRVDFRVHNRGVELSHRRIHFGVDDFGVRPCRGSFDSGSDGRSYNNQIKKLNK